MKIIWCVKSQTLVKALKACFFISRCWNVSNVKTGSLKGAVKCEMTTLTQYRIYRLHYQRTQQPVWYQIRSLKDYKERHECHTAIWESFWPSQTHTNALLQNPHEAAFKSFISMPYAIKVGRIFMPLSKIFLIFQASITCMLRGEGNPWKHCAEISGGQNGRNYRCNSFNTNNIG